MTIEELHSLQAAHDRVAALERQHEEDLRRLSAMEDNLQVIRAEIDSLRWQVAGRKEVPCESLR